MDPTPLDSGNSSSGPTQGQEQASRTRVFSSDSRTDFDVAAPAEASQPTQFGHYCEGKYLGHGGMGMVFKAHDPVLKRDVAIKQLMPGSASISSYRARFRVEGQAIARLDHPNIVPIYSFDFDADLPYFVMKYLPGGSLATLRGRFRTNPKRAAAIVALLARAVQHAHDREIFHRDLKPSNVLLDEQGEPVITDFGLAKIRDSEKDLTYTGAMLGTPAYMPPEQRLGNSDKLTAACDIFPLGLILYELIAGPRQVTTEASTATPQVVLEDLADLLIFPTGFDPALRAIIQHCVHLQPQRRYEKAADLAVDLENWIEGKPVSVRPLPPKRRSRRAFLAASGAAALGLALEGGVAAWAARGSKLGTAERIRQELKTAGVADLLLPSGQPRLQSWVTTPGHLHWDPDQNPGGVAISAPSFCALELMRDLGENNIRFSADVRHEIGSPLGMSYVGIFIGHKAIPHRVTPYHVVIPVLVSETHRAPNPIGPPRLNFDCDLRLVPEDSNKGNHFPKGLLTNAERNLDSTLDWHTLELLLTTSDLTIGIDGKQIGVVRLATIRARWNDLLSNGFLQDLRGIPELTSQEGIGLVVDRCKASFRNIKVSVERFEAAQARSRLPHGEPV